MPKPDDLRPDDYELLDFGDGRKLERFGTVVLDRLSPAAVGVARVERDWSAADLRLDERGNVLHGKPPSGPWCVGISGIQFNLRLTPFGHVGVFPEQAANWNWLQSLRHRSPASEVPRRALNLFAYTGGSTLALAQAGFEVVHVDASAPAVRWARENAAGNALGEHPLRWIVEDARKFAARELKRGRRYDLIVLDPPSFGHGPGGDRWEIEKELFPLLETCLQLLNSHSHLLLTAHSVSPAAEEIADWLHGQFNHRSQVQANRLALTDRHQRSLDSGFCIRFAPDAPA